MASGISEDVEGKDSVWALTRARLPWLLIGLGGGVGGAYVIGAFDIENNPELALFIPLIAAMGGNVGVQSSAIVVQGLASANVNMGNLLSRLLKELSVGLVNGLICSAVIFLTSLLLGFGWMLSTTVSGVPALRDCVCCLVWCLCAFDAGQAQHRPCLGHWAVHHDGERHHGADHLLQHWLARGDLDVLNPQPVFVK